MKAAGLRKSSIYWQFESKAAIAVAVMERGADRFFEALPVGGWRGETPAERLKSAFRQVSAVLGEHEQFLRLFLLLLITNQDPEVAEVLEGVRRTARVRMHELLETAFEPEGPDLAALVAERLESFAVAVFDGTFLAAQIDSKLDRRRGMDATAEALALYGQAIVAAHGAARQD